MHDRVPGGVTGTPRRENAPERRTGGLMTDPVISELLRQCESLQDVVTRIDALAARLLEVAGGAIEPPQPRERLRSAIPAFLAAIGVRG